MRSIPGALLVCAAIASGARAQVITRDDARADLDTLRVVLARNSAYRRVNGFPYERHIDSLKAVLPDVQSLRDFHRSVQTIVGALQDAHSNVRLPPNGPPPVPGELPFLLRSAGDTVVALAPSGCSLFVPGYPRVISINGVALDSMMRIAGIRFSGHSPQRFRFRALGALGRIEDVLTMAGAARAGQLTVRLGGARSDTVIQLATVPRRVGPSAPLSVTAEMMGSIAVLRIPLMWGPEDPAGEVGYRMAVAAMESESFRASRGMIIDVRNNDGGLRSLLEYMVPRLIAEPLVYNIAVARVDTIGLAERGLRLPDDRALPEAARAAMRTALARFKPRWDHSVDDFLPEVRAAVLMPVEPCAG